MSAIAAGIKKVSDEVSDPYERLARLYPALTALSPVLVLIICLYGKDETVLWSSITVAASCGGAYMLSRIARSSGQRLQSKLFESWGGAPTTQLLRHANTHFDTHTKERFHKTLSKGIGKKLPTASAETADPSSADQLYRAATVWLISQTRDSKKYPLVFKENASFGFYRNAIGLRPLGIAVAAASAAWCVASVWLQGLVSQRLFIAMIYSCMILATWIFIFNEAALKRAGFSYAERLLQSLDEARTGRVSIGGK